MEGELPCSQARDEEEFRPGHMYVAPADHHMLLEKEVIRITKGARENRSRPGIDPLFRSAAVAHGNRVTGVILTGYLDDGTAGLNAVHRCGGICVVQDPDDAAYPDMPRSALKATAVDHCVPAGPTWRAAHGAGSSQSGGTSPRPGGCRVRSSNRPTRAQRPPVGQQARTPGPVQLPGLRRGPMADRCR